ncbi:MAG TPA: sulfatase-like hydrolase/transferase, partial [Candidatus Onthocola gallistercoris]|nr:sulfatase-like hydrolase/transferase [Candidatus Onthocola gallistercoris]
EDFETEVFVENAPGKYPLAEQYLTLVHKTDEAFETLIRYLEDFDEPVILVMFGDHQPALEQEFLDLAYGVEQDEMDMSQYLDKFKVPYIIWANYDLPDEEGAETSLNFLAQDVLKYAGIPTGDYGDYLNDFRMSVPVLSFAGYKDIQGNAYSHLESTIYTQEIENYKIVQYGILFGE